MPFPPSRRIAAMVTTTSCCGRTSCSSPRWVAMLTVVKSKTTNGLGGSLISNPEMTGVTLNYLIEQCGGLKDGCNQITFTGVPEENGWNGGDEAIESMWNNILVAYEMNGEALGKSWGALMVAELGHPGGAWAKHVNGFVAESVDEPSYLYDPSWSVNNPKDTTTHFWLNAGWFNNNGETFSMSEGVDLSGWGFGWTDVKAGLLIKQFKLSFDYGETWTTYDIPAGMDSYQWVCFDMHWDPPAPGVYVVKLDAVNENDNSIKGVPGCANLLVNVKE